MFCAIISDVENKAEICFEVAKRLRRTNKGRMPLNNGDEAFVKFFNLGDVERCNIASGSIEMPLYEVTIRDVCEAVCAVSEESPNGDLLLYLAYRRLNQIDIATIHSNEVKSVCRVLYALSKSGYLVECNSKLVCSIVEKHARSMNARDISCIIQAIKFSDEAALIPLLRRIQAIVGEAQEQSAVGVKSASVLISNLANIAHEENVECLHTLKKCAEAMVDNVKRDAATIGQPETFTAIVIALGKLQAFRYNQEIYRCFEILTGHILENQLLWMRTGRIYDLNKLLSILAAIRPQAKGDKYIQRKRAPSICVEETSENVLLSGLEMVIKRLSELYVAGLGRLNSRAEGVDDTLIRNLCHFLEIYRAHDLCGVLSLGDELNRELLRTLSDRHDYMKPVDVIELVLYLQTVDPQDANLRTMQAAAIKRAETDANVDERQWGRIRRLVSPRKQ
ncbi:Cytoglobin-2, putative [Babesia ovata]|uniref:Cytoglobin-2, putative n=1 Tax=Babesia ovata TaxID=189622 RepID=A0A2H6KGV8_9APIC|nr:Cytoglobin-2, putative [Babesia ovata]GBE62226.1 Cytoglobin-2, putative [Babesia ovata]